MAGDDADFVTTRFHACPFGQQSPGAASLTLRAMMRVSQPEASARTTVVDRNSGVQPMSTDRLTLRINILRFDLGLLRVVGCALAGSSGRPFAPCEKKRVSIGWLAGNTK
jgi:hypothetical protein